jgi:hypothetical protein
VTTTPVWLTGLLYPLIVGIGVTVGLSFLRQIRDCLRTFSRRLDQVEGLSEDVTAIKKQVLPNGGSSIRDAVDRMEERQVEIAGDVTEVRDDIKAANDRLDRHIEAHLR